MVFVRKEKLYKIFIKIINILTRSIIITGLCFVILYPLLIKIMLSLMPIDNVYDLSIRYIPKSFTFINFTRVWEFLNVDTLIFNTFRLPLFTSIIQVAAGTLVSYGFARYEFKLKKLLFAIVIAAMIVPPDLILLPQYMNFRYFDILGIFKLFTGTTLNLLNTDAPLYILGMTCSGLRNSLYIFLMIQYFRGLPKEMEEVAYVDGAGTLRTFFSIFLPGATQIMITVFLFSFVWQWLDDIYTSAFMQELPLFITELSRLMNSYSVEMGITNSSEFSLMRNAGIIMLILPLLTLYIFCQSYFTESIERSGIVG